MAKKNQTQTDPKAQTLARIRRTEAYAERVRTLFAATVNEILALNKTMPQLNDGEMFSFDNESQKKQKEVERLLRQLHSVATMAIEKGIRLEWAQANAECDKLVQSCFGKRALETPEFTAWTQRNEAAMAAFIARSENGLNLSQRVWKSCRQLRDEMEVAITVAVGDGTSAASMSRSVRKYLNDPDLMFRRFRYKAGEEIQYDEDGNEIGKKIIWGKKWKKKIRKPDGTVGWIDYDKDSYSDDWTGPGYYKSSAQNAMRVARTETNIAYRRADNERWQQMDFVLGQRVQLSGNHPKKDICDKLAGDYPPDFVFDGWHPQCFCFVTPILIDEDEMLKMNEAMLNGETYTPRGKRITQYPDSFKDWVHENEERILDAHDNGRDPYFVRNNFNAVQDILNPKKQLTPQEIAEQRHAARTPEEEEKIRLAWQQRKDRIEAEKRAEEAERLRIERVNNTAQNVLKVASDRFADFDIDTVALDAAMQSGDTTLIQAETRALAKKLSEKQQQIKQTARNVINVTSKYKDFASDTSAVDALSDLLKTGNVSAINNATRALAQQIVAIRQQANAMSAIIPNAQQWTDQFTITDLQAAHDAVQAKLAQIAALPIDQQIKKLEFEINYVSNSSYGKPHTIYPTWKVSQAAYMEALSKAKHQQKVDALNTKLNVLKTYLTQHPKATALASLIQNAEISIASDDLFNAEMYIADAQKKKDALEKAQARRDAKKKAGAVKKIIKFDDEDFTQDRKDNAIWHINRYAAHDDMFDNAVDNWKLASIIEKKALIRYTEGSAYITEPLRGIDGYYHYYSGRMAQSKEDIDAMTEYIARSAFSHDMWIKRDERAAFTTYKFGIDVTKICNEERRRRQINKELAKKKAESTHGWSASDKRYHKAQIKALEDELATLTTSPTQLLGRTGVDESFLSCGSCRNTNFSGTGGDNMNGRPRVCLNIYCPKGTMMTYADAFNHFSTGYSSSHVWDGTTKKSPGECEVFLQRGTQFRVTKVEYDYDKDILYVDVDVIGQRMPEFDLQNFPSKGGYKAVYK